MAFPSQRWLGFGSRLGGGVGGWSAWRRARVDLASRRYRDGVRMRVLLAKAVREGPEDVEFDALIQSSEGPGAGSDPGARSRARPR